MRLAATCHGGDEARNSGLMHPHDGAAAPTADMGRIAIFPGLIEGSKNM
jgi:hypothetical protein